MSFWRTGREIPSLFILAIKVVRFSPNRAAAPTGPPTIQPAACNVCNIKACSVSLSVDCVGVTITGFSSDVGKGFGSTPLSERITARSIKF